MIGLTIVNNVFVLRSPRKDGSNQLTQLRGGLYCLLNGSYHTFPSTVHMAWTTLEELLIDSTAAGIWLLAAVVILVHALYFYGSPDQAL